MKQKKRLEAIECSGSPYDIGVQIGQACQANIVKGLEMTLFGLGMVHNASREEIMANARKYLSKLNDFHPALVERVKGMAEGAGLSFEAALTLQCAYDLGGYYGQLAAMCTSFAVTGAATADGKTILGQTIDWFPGCPADLIKVVNPGGGVQLSLVLWGVVEYTLSSNGFGICANGTWAGTDKCLLNIPVSAYLHKAMSQDSFDRAMEILRDNARGLGYYHLASADHKMLGIEGIQDDFEIIAPEDNILVHSNHYLTERFRGQDLAGLVVPDSFGRVERVRSLIKDQFGDITPEIMMAMMGDHAGHPFSICRHVDPNLPMEAASETLAAYVMVPETGTMYIAWGNPCLFEFEEYRL